MKPSLLFLVGPTASGKSELALRLAEILKAEIISADSMLVYRGMDIGTAKPTAEERKKITHHLIDIIAPSEDYSVFDHRRRVLDILERKENEGREFIIAGGSGLYLKALLHGISEKPGASADIRARLNEEVKQMGFEAMRERLRQIDPVYAEKVCDARRVVRALEVYELSGKTMTEWDSETRGLLDEGYPIKMFGLKWSKETLRKRIEERTRKMLSQGLIDEVKQLKEDPLSRTARQAIGYREVLEYLAGGVEGRDLLQLIVKNTMDLVKRQMTWFRREKDIQWIELEESMDLESIASVIVKEWRMSNGG